MPYEFRYGFYGDVSPDGSQIVYASCDYQNDVRIYFRNSFGYEIAMVNIDGTGRHRLTKNSHSTTIPHGRPMAPESPLIQVEIIIPYSWYLGSELPKVASPYTLRCGRPMASP